MQIVTESLGKSRRNRSVQLAIWVSLAGESELMLTDMAGGKVQVW